MSPRLAALRSTQVRPSAAIYVVSSSDESSSNDSDDDDDETELDADSEEEGDTPFQRGGDDDARKDSFASGEVQAEAAD